MENDQSRQAMDDAAKQARATYPKGKTSKDVARWWSEWFRKAGHKRLAKIMLESEK